MAKILGIDLGTTFSAMAVVENGEPKIIENKEGARTTPSVVAIDKTGKRLVGVLARRQQITNPRNTIYSIKRLIGRHFSDPEVQKDIKILPYRIKESKEGGVEVEMGGRFYKPIEISAMILQKLKEDAEDKLGEEIKEAIITCPAYFDDSQRKATKVAGEIAGFTVKRIINEPTAAALAYGLTKKGGDKKVVVYDFGGGTFDISILNINKDTVEVKATGGDTHLGGDDFDQKIMNWLIEQFKKDEGIDLSNDQMALQRLKEAAEKAKRELSTIAEAEINLPFITSTSSGPKHLYYKLTRAKFEEMIQAYVDKSINLVKRTLKEANIEPESIDDVLLVGGQTRTPLIQKKVQELFGKAPSKNINPDEVVAIGAAVEGGILQGEVRDVLLLDVTPLSLGIETLGGVSTVLIPKNTTIPTSKTQIFSTAADNQPSVEIHIVQGERPLAKDNKTLGRFILDGIPPAPRGIPQIEVLFDIDANGILKVSAKDKATGRSQSIKIEGSCGASKEEVEKMKKEAEIHAQEDKKIRELIDAKNSAESLIYTSEKALKDAEGKVNQKLIDDAKTAIEELKKVKDSDKTDEIKEKTNDLSRAIQAVGAELYQSKQKEQNKNQGTNKNDQGKPSEGEYKEK